MKVCSKCGIRKEESEFTRQKVNADGLRKVCKACIAIESKAYRTKNAEVIKWKKRAYRQGNVEKIKLVQNKFYHEKYKYTKVEYRKEYYKNNSDIIKARVKTWKAKKMSIMPKKVKVRIPRKVYVAMDIGELRNNYVLRCLKQQGVPRETSKSYPALIELKKLEILNKREIKKHSNDNKD